MVLLLYQGAGTDILHARLYKAKKPPLTIFFRGDIVSGVKSAPTEKKPWEPPREGRAWWKRPAGNTAVPLLSRPG